MNSNRALMKESLSTHKTEVEKLNNRAKLILGEIAVVLNPALLEFGEMEVSRAADLMDDLVLLHAELLGHKIRIARLEEGLYG